MKAMILAAGFGTRLRPYTNFRPKPLFPVAGRPLLHLIIEQLQTQGFGPMLVNAHHLRDQVRDSLAAMPGVEIQMEAQELGTGGGLRLALSWLEPDPVLVVNGDTLLVADLAELRDRHLASGADVSLVVHECSRFNNVLVAADGRVLGFRSVAHDQSGHAGNRLLAFTGVHFVAPRLLAGIPPGRFQDLIEYYAGILAQGGRINTLEVRRHFWSDIGTPADYLGLHADLLTGKVRPWPAYMGEPRGPFWVAEDARVDATATLHHWAAIGSGARVGAGATVSRTVVWDGAEIAAGAVVEDRIVVA